MEGVIREDLARGVETDAQGRQRVNRLTYMGVLQALRDQLRCKEIWVVGADRYRNPDEDVPQDFAVQRPTYYAALKLPPRRRFLQQVQQEMRDELAALDRTLPPQCRRRDSAQGQGLDQALPLGAPARTHNLLALKMEITKRWPMTSLLDVLKETDLRVDFTRFFRSPTAWENLDRATLQYRLLLALYGLGTGAGLKRVAMGNQGLPTERAALRPAPLLSPQRPCARVLRQSSIGSLGAAPPVLGGRHHGLRLRFPPLPGVGSKTY